MVGEGGMRQGLARAARAAGGATPAPSEPPRLVRLRARRPPWVTSLQLSSANFVPTTRTNAAAGWGVSSSAAAAAARQRARGAERVRAILAARSAPKEQLGGAEAHGLSCAPLPRSAACLAGRRARMVRLSICKACKHMTDTDAPRGQKREGGVPTCEDLPRKGAARCHKNLSSHARWRAGRGAKGRARCRQGNKRKEDGQRRVCTVHTLVLGTVVKSVAVCVRRASGAACRPSC